MTETTRIESSDRRVPVGFFGMHPDRYTTCSSEVMDREFALMAESGVETLRITIFWQFVQPWYTPRYADPRGILSDFEKYDAIIGAAARHGMQVIPTVWGTPNWASSSNCALEREGEELTVFGGVPRDVEDYGFFVSLLVRRYGPDGSYWRANPAVPYLPIRSWQPWNEPDRPAFMPQPFDADKFVALTRSAYHAIKQIDPGATVILAGLGPDCQESEALIEKIYQAGIKGLFDVMALHPFPVDAEAVIDAVRLNRRVMERYGDGDLPLVLSQFTWASSEGKSRAPWLPAVTTEQGQAKNIRELLTAAAEYRHELNIWGAYYHAWTSVDTEPEEPNTPDPWLWSGLRRIAPNGELTSKPALDAYRSVALKLAGRTSAALTTAR